VLGGLWYSNLSGKSNSWDQDMYEPAALPPHSAESFLPSLIIGTYDSTHLEAQTMRSLLERLCLAHNNWTFSSVIEVPPLAQGKS
jgi:hypothetical protein